MAGMVERHVIGVLLGDSEHNRWRTLRFKAPIYAWRMGLRSLLPPIFASITTRGRKSGQARFTMVEHFVYGGKYYFASGNGNHPDWVRNLLNDPQVTFQPAHGNPVRGTAIRIQEEASLRLAYQAMQVSPIWVPWLTSLGIKPKVEDFIAKKDRVYIFTVVADDKCSLPTLDEDLRWLSWSAMFGTFLGLLMRWRQNKRERRVADIM
ncbi:MAG: nitroreductase family deazaflavin-dependent oxidoreductase [Anaerolineae bacterium]|nr:nitroreductase family deazaflavin-dependent oxidoreductase [Anaerolineae bacterium]